MLDSKGEKGEGARIVLRCNQEQVITTERFVVALNNNWLTFLPLSLSHNPNKENKIADGF